MTTSENPTRSWREIARELASEKNPSKCVELSHELNEAIAAEQECRDGALWLARDDFRDRCAS